MTMTINFKDFALYSHKEETLEDAVKKANDWFNDKPYRILNVESIIETSGGGMIAVDQNVKAIRVWYATELQQ